MGDPQFMLQMLQEPMKPPMQPEVSQSGVLYLGVWAVALTCWEDRPSDRPSMDTVHSRLIQL